MTDHDDDLLMADLLGEAPKTPDPGFRYDVLLRTAARVRRRQAMTKALNTVALFSAIGLAFPVFGALGVTWDSAQPMALAFAVVALGLVAASVSILGPRGALARSRAFLTRA
jgi:ABC-type siderophore export system fused ATPase/permease subunit